MWTLRRKRLGVLGLAFKGDTDDIRESPAIAIIEALRKEGALVRVYDPAAMSKAKAVLHGSDVTYASDAYDAATGCDALLILTEWKEFANLDLERLRSVIKRPIVIDGRNLYATQQMADAGFIYHSIGRAIGVPEHMSSVAHHGEPKVRVTDSSSTHPAAVVV